MTYQFPQRLNALLDWLRLQGLDIAAVKSERQAAFMAQQLAGTRIKFPAKGTSCMGVLQDIQARIVTGSVSRDRPSGERPQIGSRNPKQRTVPRQNGFESHVPPGLVIYADGACHPNPGIGGWGFAVYRDGVEIHSDCGGELEATNQTMELTAALMALRWFAERGVIEPVRLLSDSQYTVKGCNEWMLGWKAKGWRRGGPNAKPENAAVANLELWQALDHALSLVPITLEWVKGHAGMLGNERADELAEMGREQVLPRREPSLIEQQLVYAI